jgi:hypothetical protein
VTRRFALSLCALTIVLWPVGSVLTADNTQSTAYNDGGTIFVGEDGDLQAALYEAQPGDTILLSPGATYSGNFVLPANDGSDYITIRSAADDSLLPGAGVRMDPAYAGQLPRVQGGIAGEPAFTTQPGAHHFILEFLEVVSIYAPNSIIDLGDGSSNQYDWSQVPHDLVIDRCYIHGDPVNGQKRGIALNSAATTIVNSYISDIKSGDEDSQAIAAWNGPGPFTIENNYLEASGENLLLGGADPAIPYLVPSDVSFRFNSVTKQPSWQSQNWTVKNLIELKNAQRVVIDSNVLEYCWQAAQMGTAVVLTPRNQDGTAPWAVVQHIQVTNNIFRHIAAGFGILGLDDTNTTYQLTNDILVRNNLFVDMSAATWGGNGWLVLTLGGSGIVFDHNTVFTDGTSVVYADVTTVEGFVFTNNIVPNNDSGAIRGSGTNPGMDSISVYYPDGVVTDNVIVGGDPTIYPQDNYFPPTVDAVGFVSLSSGNYQLAPSSPYKNAATDGLDVGADVTQLPQLP